MTSGSRANCAFMSASGILFLRASSTSQGAEKPPLLIATWQFWQRSTVGPPQEFLRSCTQYCSICGHLPETVSIFFFSSSRGFSIASSEAWALSLRAWKVSLALLVCWRSEEHTSELQSHLNLVCRLLLEKKKKIIYKLYSIIKNKKKQNTSQH